MKELKPCPFCGGEAKCYDYAPTWATTHKWVVECSICGGIIGPYKTKKKAIEAWNRRIEELTTIIRLVSKWDGD